MVERLRWGVRAMVAKGSTTGVGRLVAALLIVALILCHGALGALHQVSSWPAEHAGGHHAAAPAPVNHHAEHHGGPMAHTDYAAALFVALLGATLVLLSGRFLARGLSAHRVFKRVLVPLSPLPPRGPTLPLLQVLRL